MKPANYLLFLFLILDGCIEPFHVKIPASQQAMVVDGGRILSDEVVIGALQSSSMIFLVTTQEFPAIRNAQRYLSNLMRMGFSQDQIKIVVNKYLKKHDANHASLQQVQQTLNQPVFYGIPNSTMWLTAVNKARPLVADRALAPDLDRSFRSFVDKATGVQRDAVAKSA